MIEYTAERVCADLVFPEGPRWHDGKLWFSDFIDQRIATLDPETGNVETHIQLDDSPSGLGWTPEGELLFVSMRQRRLKRLGSDAPQTIADLSSLCGGRANDMAVDPAGGAYIGNFGFDMMGGAKADTTRLIRVDPDGSARAVGGELMFPNGIALIEDGKRLVVAETYANHLTVFDVAGNGDLSNQRVFAQFGEDVAPDGISAAPDGTIWVATARDDRCVRVREGGEIVAAVKIGAGNTYACMLGGPDGRDLFICAAPGFRPEPGQRDGAIWRARLD